MADLIAAYLAVFLAELPDKTMVATLLLTARTRRPLAVWLGVTGAFACHVALAVVAGSLLARLPEAAVAAVASAVFAIGGVTLLRARQPAQDAADGDAPVGVLRVVGLAYATILLAELGDLTQLATAGLAASAERPLLVGFGAIAALATVAGIAATTGRAIARHVPLSLVRRVGGVVFLVLAGLAAVRAIRAV